MAITALFAKAVNTAICLSEEFARNRTGNNHHPNRLAFSHEGDAEHSAPSSSRLGLKLSEFFVLENIQYLNGLRKPNSSL